MAFQEAPDSDLFGQYFPPRESKKNESAPECQERRTAAGLSGELHAQGSHIGIPDDRAEL
jgi:hypothetical protein